MSETKPNNFEILAKIDVSKHIEKKNGLSYLSWAWAVDQLMRVDPAASWEFHAPMMYGNETMMVSCTVTAFGKPMKMFLPVMDYRNKAISNPDAFAINTAMMRCLVKCIALHGLGLYIYAGEDLPLDETERRTGTITPTTGLWDALELDQQTFLQDIANEAISLINKGDVKGAIQHINDQKLDNDEKAALATRFDSKQRSAMVKARKEME